MPIDPRIALGTTLPQMRSPIQTLGALAQMRENQQQAEDRQLQMEARRRALEDDAFVRESLSRHQGNPDAAIDDLYKTGRVTAAGALSKQVFERRKAMGEQMKTDLQNDKDSVAFAAQILNGVKGEQDFQAARRAISALRPNDQQWQGLVSQLGDTYDPDRVKQAVTWGTDLKTQFDQQQRAFDNAHKAWELQLKVSEEGREREKTMVEVRGLYQKSASDMLSTARNQEQWDSFQRLLAHGGVPTDILARFGNKFSPESVERARALGMTAAEEENARHQRVTEGETARHNRASEATARAQVEKNPQSEITKRSSLDRRATAERWKAAQFKAIEEAGYGDEEASNRRRAVEQSFRTQVGDPTAEEAEAWKTADYADLEKDPTLAPEKKTARKLEIEDTHRKRLGLPPLLDAERELSATGNAKELAKVRKVLKDLTGQSSLLERMETLDAKIRSEKDRTKQAAFKQELAALREQYRAQTGR
jgi:hypothetical protein